MKRMALLSPACGASAGGYSAQCGQYPRGKGKCGVKERPDIFRLQMKPVCVQHKGGIGGKTAEKSGAAEKAEVLQPGYRQCVSAGREGGIKTGAGKPEKKAARGINRKYDGYSRTKQRQCITAEHARGAAEKYAKKFSNHFSILAYAKLPANLGSMNTVADIMRILDGEFPPRLAETWDRVGLTAGDPAQPVTRVGFAVDPCEATVEEAVSRGAQMLVTHHPLYLRGTSSVAAVTGKGRWIQRLIKADCALFSAHTNADAAARGSATALADLLRLENRRPLSPNPDYPQLGIGKIGELPVTMSVEELARRLKALLPETQPGILIGGDPERIVRTVALSPGAGDSFLDAVSLSGADVYITADLRHHRATDHLWNGGCALISVTHFASEWPVLKNMERAVKDALQVQTYVSAIVTDPWTQRV